MQILCKSYLRLRWTHIRNTEKFGKKLCKERKKSVILKVLENLFNESIDSILFILDNQLGR